jgi:hypothetical protein
VSFCGVDDLTEIAYLSLREAGLDLAAVMDEHPAQRTFIGIPVVSLEEGVSAGGGPIIITSLPRAGQLRAALGELGVRKEEIFAPAYGYEEILSR